MNYSTDRAITSIEEDLLGRATFSKQLGQAIYDYKGKDSLVIGLFGKWGTGKTSVANMALQTVEVLSKNDTSPPIMIRFAPWNYSDKDNLISQFLSSLKAYLSMDSNEFLKVKVGKALSDYSSIFEFASLIPVLGSPLAVALKGIVKASGDELSKPQDLNTTKHKLEDALLEADQKIIILIDDIDRLSNSQIRDVFQLVKQVGDLPNIIYLLAMDRDIVRRALSSVQNYDGSEYLEKIIQISFEMPEMRKTRLHDFFFSKINEVIREISKDITWDQQYFNKVFNNCIAPYLLTLRDVNRMINTFQFRYSMLYKETSLEDMLGITTLEVLKPDLYKWIAENKVTLCGNVMHGYYTARNESEDNKKRYEAVFQTLGLDPEKSIKSVAAMFPAFAKDVGVHFYEANNNANIRVQMRAAQIERFDLYFVFDLDDVKVPRSTIIDCIHFLNEDELKKKITDINSQGNIVFFIDEIRAMVEEIPYERLSLLASVFMDLYNGFRGETPKAFFSVSASYLATDLTDTLVRKLKTNEERFELFRDALLNANKFSLGAVARVIRKLEWAYGRFTDEKEEEKDQLVSLEQLICLEKMFLTKIEEFTKSDILLDTEETMQAFYLWRDLEKDQSQLYVREIFKNEIKKLKFICKYAGKWSGTNGSGWSFSHNYYSDYASEEDIYNSIQTMDKNKLGEFTELEQIQLASFVLNYQKDEFMHVTEEQAKQLVNQWKNNIM